MDPGEWPCAFDCAPYVPCVFCGWWPFILHTQHFRASCIVSCQAFLFPALWPFLHHTEPFSVASSVAIRFCHVGPCWRNVTARPSLRCVAFHAAELMPFATMVSRCHFQQRVCPHYGSMLGPRCAHGRRVVAEGACGCHGKRTGAAVPSKQHQHTTRISKACTLWYGRCLRSSTWLPKAPPSLIFRTAVQGSQGNAAPDMHKGR